MAVSSEDHDLLGCSATPYKTFLNFLVSHKLDFTLPVTGSWCKLDTFLTWVSWPQWKYAVFARTTSYKWGCKKSYYHLCVCVEGRGGFKLNRLKKSDILLTLSPTAYTWPYSISGKVVLLNWHMLPSSRFIFAKAQRHQVKSTNMKLFCWIHLFCLRLWPWFQLTLLHTCFIREII